MAEADIIAALESFGGRFDRLDAPIQDQGGVFQQLHIGHNTWIGNSTVVMADVAADSVIGAGSVVVHPIPARSVAAGNPAVVKKERDAGLKRPRSMPTNGHTVGRLS